MTYNKPYLRRLMVIHMGLCRIRSSLRCWWPQLEFLETMWAVPGKVLMLGFMAEVMVPVHGCVIRLSVSKLSLNITFQQTTENLAT